MTKHLSQIADSDHGPLTVDAGYERGMHAAYLTVYGKGDRVLYDDNVDPAHPVGTMKPEHIVQVLRKRFGVQLPDGMLQAIRHDYDTHAAPRPQADRWPDATRIAHHSA